MNSGAGTGSPETSVLRERSDIYVAPDGRVHGADGMLDQIASAFTRSLVRDGLPVLQRDQRLQDSIGAAVGRGIGEQIAPWLALGAGALALLVLVQITKPQRRRP